jgi:mono/diheme cytochrome c family protein
MRKLVGVLAVMLVLGAGLAYFGWDRFFRERPQPDWVMATPDMRFMYGSIGAEQDSGIPYGIFAALPRIFPEKFPGPEGFASLGAVVEEGRTLPVGFTEKVIGFPRVANNCAACHVATYRVSADAERVVVPTGPSHGTDLEAFFRLLVDTAKDPRFDADTMMPAIEQVTDLDFIDRLAYRYLFIPITRKRLLEREEQFGWIYRTDFPDWGPGRDDAMNLTKYFMLEWPMDDSFGPTDMPSIWNLKKYQAAQGHRPNLAGDSHDNEAFLEQVSWLQDYLGNTPAPAWPLPVDQTKAEAGRAVFQANCAGCHAGERTGTPLPIAEIGTDRGRIDTWSKEAAAEANEVARGMGIERNGLVEEDLVGYVAPFLDGIWLRGPYLHNGAVPTVWDLLQPPDARPATFWRGYDVLDAEKLGFVSRGAEAQAAGFRFDTTLRGNGNGGHDFGTDLPDEDKQALIEHLKTL